MTATNKETIAILGAGFGGLHAALSLSKKLKKLNLTDKYRILLLDQHDYHTYTPTLYEVATTSEEVAGYMHLKEIVTFPLIHSIDQSVVEFIRTKITKIDLFSSDVHTESGTIVHYSYLIIALGSETNYHNIPGLAEGSLPLKQFCDALDVREKIVTEVSDPEIDKLHILIGGGGSTGVELAGEMKLWLCHLKRIKSGACWADVTIVQGSKNILQPFGVKIQNAALKKLRKLGINVLTEKRISAVEGKKIILSNGRKVPFDLLIWTGGVKANHLMRQLPLEREPVKETILANNFMQLNPENRKKVFPGSIYGIGDCITFFNPKTNKPVPGVARAAIVQSLIAAHNIAEEIKTKEGIKEKEDFKSYKPLNYPYIIPVGGKWAIAKFGPILIIGFWGWIIKGLVELNYLLSIIPFFRSIKLWLKGLRIFIQNNKME